MAPENSPVQVELESRLRFETLIADLASNFISLPTSDAFRWVTEAQRRVCQTLDLDLSTLWLWEPENPGRIVLRSYYRPVDEPPVPEPMYGEDFFPWTLQFVRAGRVLALSSVESVPPEAARDLETWRHFGVKTNLSIPLSVGGAPPIGVLSFNDVNHERVWPEALISRLQLVAQLFAIAVTRDRTEQALRASEARLALAASAAGAGAWDLDIRTGRIWATPEAKILYAFPPDRDVDLEEVLERVHPEDRDEVRTRLLNAVSQRASYNADYRLVLPDGTIRWVNARGRPHATRPDAEPDRLMGFSVEITARKLSEVQAKRQQARLAAAMDAAALGLYETDSGFRLVYLDDRLRDLIGIQPEGEGRVRDFWLEHVHREDHAAVSEASRAMLEGERERVSIEYRYQHPDGSSRWLSHVSHVLERDSAGRTVRTVGVVQDITERKLAEEALSDRTERLSMALASGRMVAWDMKLPELTITWAESSEDLFGRGAGRFPGHATEFTSLEHPGSRDSIAAAFRRLHAEVGQDTIEARVVWPDGSDHWHQIFARSVAGPDGSPDRVAGLTLDITERKRNEEELRRALEEVRRLRDRLREENLYLQQEVKGLQTPFQISGRSAAIREALDQARQVAPTASTVLLVGETGTGKERFASVIHDLSPRRDRPMVRVNCAAIPTTLIESELFGREKGAYTGALSRQAGRFELANGSTLFLDEIGDLPPDVQVKLLRVLQEKQIERLGSPRAIPVDVRIIAATHRDLQQAVREGRFREDLYYRLNVFPITIPPVRQRREDIPQIVAALVEELSTAMNKQVDSISRSSMDALVAYDWPGNIRELRNVLERAMILATGPVLHVDVAGAQLPPTAPEPSRNIQEVEREHIVKVLKETGWRIRGENGAAAALGLKATTLEYRMAKLGIKRPGAK